MKTYLLLASCFFVFLFSSCVKQNDATVDPNVLTPASGFLWEMSRNITVKIAINDIRFGDALHTIGVYSSNPATGGKLIAKGSASTGKPFSATVYLTDTLSTLFIVKTAPDNSVMQKQISLVSNSAADTLGIVPVPSGRPLGGPDCSTGCSRIITKGGNIDVNSGETVCITGSNITVSYTSNSNGTIRICGSNVTIQNSNLNNNSKLIIASTGSVSIQNLNINNGNSFENYGTCTVTSGFAPNGPVINAGTLAVAGDFNVNNTGSIANTGTISVKGTMNVNAAGSTNKGSITTNAFTVNSGATFTNFCGLAIAADYNNNGTMANYQLITVGGTTTVNSGAELGLYNSAMITSRDMMLNGYIKGYGTTSLAKVAGRTTINSNAGATGEVQYCDANGIEVNNAGIAAFSKGAVQGCSVYIPVSGCNAIGNGKPVIVDGDGDGVADSLDAYPLDASKAFNNFYPADSSKVTVAFEDLWPSKGDFDFNDLVMDYHYNIITNAANKVAAVVANFTLLASGGTFSNGFGVEFPIISGAISNVTGGGTLEAGQANAVIILFKDMHQQMTWSNTDDTKPQSTPIPYTVSFNVQNGPLLSAIGIGAYNPFTWNNLTATATSRNEIHLSGHPPTSLGSTSLFSTGDDNTSISLNRFYLSKDGMPWALTIPTTFKYPKEGDNISLAYTHFIAWANSGSLSYLNWYSNLSGYRVNSYIYLP